MKSYWQLWFLVTFKGIWNLIVFVFEEAGDLENFRTIFNLSIHHIYIRTSIKGTLLDTLTVCIFYACFWQLLCCA